MDFIDYPSVNFNDRQDGAKPSLIILHYTSCRSTEHALEVLTDASREKKVSAHYVIDEDGKIYRLVDENKRAWHAGESYWHGITDVNSASIGIELSNREHQPYPPAQLKALQELCKDIMRRHDIPAQNIVGHSDIAPHRKQDPGYHFPWSCVTKIPKPRLRDHFNAKAVAKNPEKLKKLFHRAGYGVEQASLEQLVNAFQQHYEPHVFTQPRHGEAPGKPTAKTVAKLRAVARKAHKNRH